MDTFKHAVHSVMNAIHPADTSVSRAQVIALEEHERMRRAEHPSQSALDMQNARKVSQIVSKLNFPVLNSANIGYKKYTLKCEEQERRRRLENKTEYELRKFNALKMTGIIHSLGWPFCRPSDFQGVEYIFPDQTLRQEEVERTRRLNNPMLSTAAKRNAAWVAGIARWAHFKKNPLAGSKRYTRGLEEKERKRRLESHEGLERACEHSYAEARCIRGLGYPFFIQNRETSNVREVTLEEKERARRLHDVSEQRRARQQAAEVSSFIVVTNIDSLEDKERERRVQDTQGQQLAMENASRVAGLINSPSVEALESSERERRLGDFEEQASAIHTARQISKLVLSSQRETKYSQLDNSEMLERECRLANPMEQLYARQNATKIASIITQAGFRKPSISQSRSLSSSVGSTPSTRLVDAQEESVSVLVKEKVQPAAYNGNTWDLENQERDRRIGDQQYQQQARANAQKVSSLLRAAYEADKQKNLSSFDIELGLPVAAPQVAPVMVEPPVVVSPLSTPTSTSTSTSTSTFSSTSTTQQSSVLTSAKNFISALPAKSRNLLHRSGSQQNAAAYVTTPTIVTAPTVVSTSIVSAPIVTAPTSVSYVAPVAMPTQYNTVYSSSAVPATGRGLQTAHNDVERKVLTKEATKHAKLASKESKKAEKQVHKAEQLHMKGKDTRAAKYEANAEQHALAAKHHQQWAEDAQLLAGSATDPSSFTSPARPAM